MLWHQRLGHPSDHYLYKAHKFVTGVPKFRHESAVMDTCPTCIEAKRVKSPPTGNTTLVATQPYQGLSVDFLFSGTKSKNKEQRKDYVGINGATSAVVVLDHFTRTLERGCSFIRSVSSQVAGRFPPKSLSQLQQKVCTHGPRQGALC